LAIPRTLTVLATPLLAAWLGCSPASPSPAATPSETLTLRSETAHFVIYAGLASESLVQDVANRLEGERGRVLADLRLGNVPLVAVRVWSDSSAYYEAMGQYLGTRYSGASGYVAGPAEIRLLSSPQLASNAVHEFCHIASLQVNGTIANNPRWLWETVAVYENREFVQPTSLGYLQTGTYPSLSELNAGANASRQVYELGFLIGEFIVSTWEQDALVRLIQTNGDLRTVVGLDDTAFMERWYAFVRRKYFQ
jgi:hypothetical protein